MPTTKKNVVVLGAGVSGLTSALLLLETYNLNSLTILSSELPGDTHAHDYTSPWAGGNWMSFATDVVKDAKQIEYDSITYKVLQKLADSTKECGIRKIKAKYLYDTTIVSAPWYIAQRFATNVTSIPKEEIKARNLDPSIYEGYEYDTFTITPVIYCHYLRSQIEKLGGKVIRIAKIENLPEFLQKTTILPYKPDLVVNCTGLGALKILSHLPGEESELTKIYPVKGQIVVVHQDLPFQLCVESLPASDSFGITEGEQFSHIFPRGDGYSIIGGIMVKNDWSKTVSPKVTESILNNITKHVPELGDKKDLVKIYDYAALRPGREGGVRVEYKEYFDGSLKIVHNYGIGGAGYQASYGLAAGVTELAASALGQAVKCPYKL